MKKIQEEVKETTWKNAIATLVEKPRSNEPVFHNVQCGTRIVEDRRIFWSLDSTYTENVEAGTRLKTGPAGTRDLIDRKPIGTADISSLRTPIVSWKARIWFRE
ncbi:hypothetical protein K0M31_012750 [Melipona bicolor]|uniref:Uncharacterized protein n=1 Tax=Melipona bicolor TaxID=60889 RepID=A0AA40FJZ6_9HYME|nr:hypothetical protein K0M31_012750 [Melipona bicolor]